MNRSAHLAVPAAALLCTWAASAHADDLVVDPGGGGDFTSIQAAVAAAAPDDLILVHAGTYTEDVSVEGKPLWIVAEAPRGGVIVNGTLFVRELALGETVVVIGLDVRGLSEVDLDGQPALVLTDNAGEVRVQSSSFRGGDGVAVSDFSGTKAASAALIHGSRVTLSGCVFRGGEGIAANRGGPGGDGVAESTSSVAAWGCEFRGGNGGSNNGISGPFGEPSDGGAGFRATSFGVFAAGCLFQGGNGGNENDLCIYPGGDGGPGLFLPAIDTQARLMASTLQGGTGGVSCPSNSAGAPGGAFAGGGSPIQVNGAARWLAGQAVVSAGTPAPFTVHGASGDVVYLRQDDEPRYHFKPLRKGFDLVEARWMPIEPYAVPASGTLATTRADHAWAGGDRTRLFGQAYVVTATGAIVLGGPLALVVGP